MADEKEATMKALFEDGNEDFAEEFRDRVKAIHENFDKDGDGYLNFEELGELQLLTSGNVLDGDQYVMVCRCFGGGCHPKRGINIEALRLTYAAASDGTELEKDYYKVFPERKKEKEGADKKKKSEEGNKVYEMGEDGYDLS